MTTWTGTVPTIASGDTTTVPANLATYRDIHKALSEAWTNYGSGASWTAATSNPAIGNGTWAGAYMQVGKFVQLRVTITMGTTTTYGTGGWRVALPVTPKAGVRWRFLAEAWDSAGTLVSGVGVVDASGAIALYRVGGSAAADSVISGSGTAPIAWGSTDVLTVMGSYEAA